MSVTVLLVTTFVFLNSQEFPISVTLLPLHISYSHEWITNNIVEKLSSTNRTTFIYMIYFIIMIETRRPTMSFLIHFT